MTSLEKCKKSLLPVGLGEKYALMSMFQKVDWYVLRGK